MVSQSHSHVTVDTRRLSESIRYGDQLGCMIALVGHLRLVSRSAKLLVSMR